MSRVYHDLLIFCPECPPFRPGPTVAGLLPHVLWAELRRRGGTGVRGTLFDLIAERGALDVRGYAARELSPSWVRELEEARLKSLLEGTKRE